MYMEYPCYVIASDGMRLHASYRTENGEPHHLRTHAEDKVVRDAIKEHIRQDFQWRNRIPLYSVSDHGNVMQVRRITLRRPK